MGSDLEIFLEGQIEWIFQTYLGVGVSTGRKDCNSGTLAKTHKYKTQAMSPQTEKSLRIVSKHNLEILRKKGGHR